MNLHGVLNKGQGRRLRARRGAAMVAAVAVAMLGGIATAVTASATDHQVWICHATTSDTNPYRIIPPDVNSTIYQGHLLHVTRPPHKWKSAGTFGGVEHAAGQSKPDILGNANSAPPECFATPPLPNTPNISLDKTPTLHDDAVTNNATGFADVGEKISYSFTVTNTGDVKLFDITVTDPMLGDVTCEEVSLDPDESTTCTAAEYTVKSRDVNAAQISNTATVTGLTEGDDEVTDTDTANVPTHKYTSPLPNTPNISLDKTPTLHDDAVTNNATGFADVGEKISYSFTVTNTGDVKLFDITVTDPMLGDVTCEEVSLDPDESTTCTAAEYTVKSRDVNAAQISNTATVTGLTEGDDEVTDTDTANVPTHKYTPSQGPGPGPGITTIITDVPGISLVKSYVLSGSDALADAGETISYSLLVTNTGNVRLTSVEVVDLMAGVSAVSCPSTTLAAAATFTCTASYIVTPANVTGVDITNEANASGKPPTGGRVEATAFVNTPTAKPVAKKAVTPKPTVKGVVKNAPVKAAPAPAVAPAVKTLAFTGAETVPLGLSGLLALLLGAVLTVASRQRPKQARE